MRHTSAPSAAINYNYKVKLEAISEAATVNALRLAAGIAPTMAKNKQRLPLKHNGTRSLISNGEGDKFIFSRGNPGIGLPESRTREEMQLEEQAANSNYDVTIWSFLVHSLVDEGDESNEQDIQLNSQRKLN